jgi:hypothetical protein
MHAVDLPLICAGRFIHAPASARLVRLSKTIRGLSVATSRAPDTGQPVTSSPCDFLHYANCFLTRDFVGVFAALLNVRGYLGFRMHQCIGRYRCARVVRSGGGFQGKQFTCLRTNQASDQHDEYDFTGPKTVGRLVDQTNWGSGVFGHIAHARIGARAFPNSQSPIEAEDGAMIVEPCARYFGKAT